MRPMIKKTLHMKNKQVKTLVCVILAMHCMTALATDAVTPTKRAAQAGSTFKLKAFNAAPRPVNQPNPTNLQELPPDTIQTIQLIGRSVLAAKHGESVDPNTAQVKSRLQNLRQSLDDVIKVDVEPVSGELTASSPTASINTDTNKNSSSSNKSNKFQTDHEAKQQQHQQNVAVLKQSISDLKADNQQRRQSLVGRDESTESEHQPHIRNLLDKSQAFTDEVDAALADNGPEHMAKLMQLRDRLTIKTLNDMKSVKTAAKETPTMSTITRHRE